MEMVLTQEAPPLQRDDTGALRVGSSRVLLELVIQAFEDGATAEMIVQQYPTTTLADVYSAIGYYLRHRPEIDAYLADRERQALTIRQRIEAHQGDLTAMRNQLLARKQAQSA